MTVKDDIDAGRLRWASEPRLDNHVNEDRIGMARDAVWVLDGATVSSCCDKDANWYVGCLSAALARRLIWRGVCQAASGDLARWRWCCRGCGAVFPGRHARWSRAVDLAGQPDIRGLVTS
jgi:hypothetical protein